MGSENSPASLISQKTFQLRHIAYREDGRTSVSSPAGHSSKACFSCLPSVNKAGNSLFGQPWLIAYCKADSIQTSLLQLLLQCIQSQMNGMRNAKAAVSVFYGCKPVFFSALKNLLILAYQNFSAENGLESPAVSSRIWRYMGIPYTGTSSLLLSKRLLSPAARTTRAVPGFAA